VFFVAITSTGIYCRPVYPSRPADPGSRRFYASAAAAERGGFRPCLRCRPELAPGRALVDAVHRLASAATDRIAAGALNGRPVASLASERYVSERHLRRAVKRELRVSPSPVELAQSYRLLMAKRLLADTSLDMSRVAYASGFQSLRRFNAVVRERYGMAPTALRRAARSQPVSQRAKSGNGSPGGPIQLTLAYRPPARVDRDAPAPGRAGDARARARRRPASTVAQSEWRAWQFR
jgi:AraC family transcriptional regulator of adaptative response / DNA-3-methyladenine glycosylase II